MKRILLFTALVIAVAGIAWYATQPRINIDDKFHKNLYVEADGTFDAQMVLKDKMREEEDGSVYTYPTFIRAEWAQPDVDYNHFVITISDPDGDFTRSESGEHDRVSLELSDLEPETEYVIALRACLQSRCDTWLVSDQEYRGQTPAKETDNLEDAG